MLVNTVAWFGKEACKKAFQPEVSRFWGQTEGVRRMNSKEQRGVRQMNREGQQLNQ